jgi:hypothetical protein
LHATPHPPQFITVFVGTHFPEHAACPEEHMQALFTHVSPVEVQSAVVAQPARHMVPMQASPPEQSALTRQPARQDIVVSSQIRPAPHAASWWHPSKQVRVAVLHTRPVAQSPSCEQPITQLPLERSQ